MRAKIASPASSEMCGIWYSAGSDQVMSTLVPGAGADEGADEGNAGGIDELVQAAAKSSAAPQASSPRALRLFFGVRGVEPEAWSMVYRLPLNPIMFCTTASLCSATSASSRARSAQSSHTFFDFPADFTVSVQAFVGSSSN
jgi:hypothetical protein